MDANLILDARGVVLVGSHTVTPSWSSSPSSAALSPVARGVASGAASGGVADGCAAGSAGDAAAELNPRLALLDADGHATGIEGEDNTGRVVRAIAADAEGGCFAVGLAVDMGDWEVACWRITSAGEPNAQ